MTTTEKLVLNKTQNQVHRVLCLKCTGKTDHNVLSSVDISGDEGDRDFSVSWMASYQVIQCLGCKIVSFRKVSSNSEDFFHNDEGETEYAESEELYPSRIEGRRSIGDDVYYLPTNVRQIYEETLLALINRAPILAGIGLRALLESVCKEKQATGKDLFQKIDDLCTKGILTPAGASILHKIRTLGNAAAHEVKPHRDKQLGLAMDIIEHLLKDVYILPKQVESEFEDR